MVNVEQDKVSTVLFDSHVAPSSLCMQTVTHYFCSAFTQCSPVMSHPPSVFLCAAGYDCGVYLVCFAEQVVQQVLLKDTRTLQQAVDPAMVKQWRKKVLNSIQQKQKM